MRPRCLQIVLYKTFRGGFLLLPIIPPYCFWCQMLMTYELLLREWMVLSFPLPSSAGYLKESAVPAFPSRAPSDVY